jgi:ribosomal protein S18 acetylase RimI-like enzyme
MKPEPAKSTDVPALARTFALAFAHDPMTVWRRPTATPLDLQAYYYAIVTEYVALGVMWQTHGCRAGAAWLGPEEVDRRKGKRRSGDRPEAQPREAPVPASDSALWDWLDARLPLQPVWFLDLIAVSPESQRHGWGSELVELGMDRARAARCPAFLETSLETNVKFYEHHGFQIVDEGTPPDGGPMVWFMQASP